MRRKEGVKIEIDEVGGEQTEARTEGEKITSSRHSGDFMRIQCGLARCHGGRNAE